METSPEYKGINKINSLEELTSLERGAILEGIFQNPRNDENAFVIYNGTINEKDTRIAEFLEMGEKSQVRDEETVYSWKIPASKLVFPGDGIVMLPTEYGILKMYDPSNKEYLEKRELVRNLEKIFQS